MAQPQTKGKYWLANNPNAQITDAEVAELGTISEVDFDALSQLAQTGAELNQRVLQMKISDVSTAGQTYATVPWGCKLIQVDTVLNGGITGSDATLTVKNGSGSSAGTITIAVSGSAAGNKDQLTPTSNNVFNAGDLLEIETDGGSTGDVEVDITCLFEIT